VLPSHHCFDVEVAMGEDGGTMTLTIPSTFNGPPDSGNGGYVAGRVAETLLQALGLPTVGDGTPWVEVTLRTPPPLDVACDTRLNGHTLVVTAGDDMTVVAEARTVADADVQVDPIPPVDLETAQAAEARYLGLTTHPFPTCWVCGPARPDGYHLQPGVVEGPNDGPGDEVADGDAVRTACRWSVGPDAADPASGEVPAASVWAALDCPGGWTALASGRVVVLGRITARVASVPQVGDQCVVQGRLLGSEGRKSWTSTSVTSADGVEHARALATWIAIGTV
jgi:hypothetical protein